MRGSGRGKGRNGEWPEWRMHIFDFLAGMANAYDRNGEYEFECYNSIVYVYNSILTCIRRLELGLLILNYFRKYDGL
jgi:hypothetical protein